MRHLLPISCYSSVTSHTLIETSVSLLSNLKMLTLQEASLRHMFASHVLRRKQMDKTETSQRGKNKLLRAVGAEIQVLISIISMLANVSVTGYNVYCCLAAPSADQNVAEDQSDDQIIWAIGHRYQPTSQNRLSGGTNQDSTSWKLNGWTLKKIRDSDPLCD